MKRFKKILAAIDTRLETPPIIEEAFSLAITNRASLTIVDVVPAPSWFAEMVTPEFSSMQQHYTEEVKARLERIAEGLRQKGLTEVTTRVLSGKASVEIVREVQHQKHDLVLAVAKGKSSKRNSCFGYTAIRLLRECPCAVWLMRNEGNLNMKHVLGCVDVLSEHSVDEALNRKVYELSKSIADFHDSKVSVLHAWQMADEAVLSARLPRERIAEFLKDRRDATEKKFNAFLETYGSHTDSENIHLIQGTPEESIEEYVRDHSVDLVVMGTVARSGLSNLLMGNTAEKVLDRIDCSVLAVKPDEFRTRIS